MKDDRVYLQHIRDALEDIAAYCGNDHDALIGDRMRQDVTLRKLQEIGQAVKNLSEHTKSHAPEIPWKQIAGMRDKVIHDYFGVNLEIVSAVVQTELPSLRQHDTREFGPYVVDGRAESARGRIHRFAQLVGSAP